MCSRESVPITSVNDPGFVLPTAKEALIFYEVSSGNHVEKRHHFREDLLPRHPGGWNFSCATTPVIPSSSRTLKLAWARCPWGRVKRWRRRQLARMGSAVAAGRRWRLLRAAVVDRPRLCCAKPTGPCVYFRVDESVIKQSCTQLRPAGSFFL